MNLHIHLINKGFEELQKEEAAAAFNGIKNQECFLYRKKDIIAGLFVYVSNFNIVEKKEVGNGLLWVCCENYLSQRIEYTISFDLAKSVDLFKEGVERFKKEFQQEQIQEVLKKAGIKEINRNLLPSYLAEIDNLFCYRYKKGGFHILISNYNLTKVRELQKGFLFISISFVNGNILEMITEEEALLKFNIVKYLKEEYFSRMKVYK